MKTKITAESLIDIGFVNSDLDEYTYHMNGNAIEVYGDNVVDICLAYNWNSTNAKTIEDIKDLIRLFK
jgi:hypothetical protein